MTGTASGLHLRIAEGDAMLAACLSVRRAVFVGEQGVSVAKEVDGLDAECIHILATDGAEAVGAARIRPLGAVAKIQRVCVLDAWRGTGAGARIMAFAIDHARRDGRFSKAVLGAQVQALGFYRRLGFVEFGDDYLDAGILHRDMALIL